MEALSASLQPYREIIGSVASVVTIGQFFAGAFICNDIRKKGSTKDISSMPFVGGIVVGLAMLKYGLLLGDPAMLRVNTAAIGLNILYCLFYYSYADDKWNDIVKHLTFGIPLVAALYGYCGIEDPKLVEFRYGMIVTILMLALLGSPLVGLKDIIDKKDASSIPFVLTLMGTIVTFLWLLYGIILLNNFMIFQNVIGFTLCFVQLVLIFIYPGKPVVEKHKKKN